MLKDLTKQQRLLADAMSAISEKCWSAGWMSNLEYALWHALISGERKYGQDFITQQDINTLLSLSKECDDWIYLSDTTKETAIELSKWRLKFDQVILQNPEITRG